MINVAYSAGYYQAECGLCATQFSIAQENQKLERAFRMGLEAAGCKDKIQPPSNLLEKIIKGK